MQHLRVGVLRGGPSEEYDVSLKTGNAVLSALPEYMQGVDVFIDREGTWHSNGLPMKPADALRQVDIVWNALRGFYGEDGKVQKLLDMLALPYTGTGPYESFVGMQKHMAKDALRKSGLRLPQHILFTVGEQEGAALAGKMFRTAAAPWVVKPVASGSSLGVRLARTASELADIVDALSALEEGNDGKQFLIEEHIRGTEVTVSVIDGFRGESLYVLPPVEIKFLAGKKFYDNEMKQSGGGLVCPGFLPAETKRTVMDAARTVHKILGLRDFSRSDFVVTPYGVYFLETNTLPGLTDNSPFAIALDSVGASLKDFVDHILQSKTKNNSFARN